MRIFRIPFDAMASACEVVVAAADDGAAQVLARSAIEEVQRIERAYSRYRPDSILSRINAAAGQDAMACDDETWALLEHADALYRLSDGAFDITSGVLRRAWNFRQPRLPDAAEVAALLPLIGWPRVERQGRQVRLPQAGMELDFGGFGKEYAADRAAGRLLDGGVRHGYVNLAGDVRIVGPKPDGTPWTVGIRDPRRSGLMASIPISRGALATSGDYERFFEHAGRRYCHVLDPRSGWPVTFWRSVSVLAPIAVTAGNCSTIAMLKGPDGLAFLQASGFGYLAVDQDGILHTKDTAATAPRA